MIMNPDSDASIFLPYSYITLYLYIKTLLNKIQNNVTKATNNKKLLRDS